MTATVEELAKTGRWKPKAILGTRRFNTGEGLVSPYKAQLLSFIEYRTAAIYHDGIQNKILSLAGMSKLGPEAGASRCLEGYCDVGLGPSNSTWARSGSIPDAFQGIRAGENGGQWQTWFAVAADARSK